MSCVLRVSASNLNVAEAMRGLPVQPYRVWARGEPKAPRSSHSQLHETSGACFHVSGAEMTQFPAQLEEATAFLVQHISWLADLRKNALVEDMRLDFGVERSNAWIQCLVLPVAFLAAASSAGVSVELSTYSPSREG